MHFFFKRKHHSAHLPQLVFPVKHQIRWWKWPRVLKKYCLDDCWLAWLRVLSHPIAERSLFMLLREDSNHDREYTHCLCIFIHINNSKYISHHWHSNITLCFIITAYKISNYTKFYQRTQIFFRENILLWNFSPSTSYWKGHLSASPASQPERRLSTAHAQHTQGLHCHGADKLKLLV